ncbi:MAG: S8 family serine peptidase [Meiothermus sp.]|uniref:S8 family peptidase n=1 Tax=Meiothermus sp. TaxID=1955249 RepID=UPI0025CE4938|nr:S8 family serine peptidase [Meiothermus sp.]MCS7068016.1 S8 family serine peptidase [Meiothermus sp.]MDW8424405.1 S8 family serine peptidase [Meiothermus sp.]
MRWMLVLAVSLVGCDLLRGGGTSPITAEVYPAPRRAAWEEEVRVSLPWRAGSSLSLRLAGEAIAGLRTEPEGAGSAVIFKVPSSVWGGPQALDIADGANRATGSLTVLGESVGAGALVVLKPGVSDSAFAQQLAGAGLRLVPNTRGEPSVPLGAASGPCAGRLAQVGQASGPPLAVGALLERLEAAAGSQVVDLDGILGIDPLTGYDTGSDLPPSPNSSPINARQAIQRNPASNFTGAGTTIAVVDTGVASLTSLNLRPGADFTNLEAPNPNLDEYRDGQGHGTAVAVLAAGAAYGVAPAAGILPVKSCDKNGKCPLAAVIRGICYAIAYAEQNKNQKLVLNLSLGSDTPSEIVYILLKDALMKRGVGGIPVVAAAGNQWAIRSSKKGTLHHFPASFGGLRGLSASRDPARRMTLLKGLLSVGAVGLYGTEFRVSGFSNQGDYVDLVAPGERVRSLRPGGLEAEFTGTSFAAPLVAGAAAVVRQASAFTPLTPEALELTLLANLTNPGLPAGAPPEARGQGMLDMSGGP